MGSEDFRIIPHMVAQAVHASDPDLYRYIITFASSGQPLFVAASSDNQPILVSDDKSALRFPTIEDAEQWLATARPVLVTQLSGPDRV
jgi:hypothetical protein